MIYHIFANRSNIGDWLSAKGIQKLLSPLAVTECLCDGPFVKETMRQLSSATKDDLIVIGGGGLLMDYFEPFWKEFRKVADRVPFCIWGIGYCDEKNTPSLPRRSLIEEIVRKSRLCVVRDELSRNYLQIRELASPVSCPSVCVIDPPAEQGNGILHVVNYTTAGADTYESMCAAARAFGGETARIYRETNNRISKNSEQELAQILSRYEKSDIVLSSGLHGCIIGVAMGLKVLAVSGDHKIDAFMETVGLKDWSLDVRAVKRVPDLLRGLSSQKNVRPAIEDIIMRNRDVAEKIKQISGRKPS